MSDPAALTVEHDADAHEWFIAHDGARVGRMVYTPLGPRAIRVDHTEVGEALKGRGAAKLLLAAAVAWARAAGATIDPVCPFARAQFDKDPSLADVRAR